MEHATPLAAWMTKAGILDQQLADKVGCDRSTITRLRLGRTMPSMALVFRLVVHSGGGLRADDFLPRAAPKRRRSA